MNVGEVVTIRVRDARNAAVFASGVINPINEYTGQILPNPKWIASDAICISTGDSQFPFRVIDRDRIVGLDISLARESEKAIARSETFIVQGSKPGTTYTVTRDSTQWSCTCVGFGFRKDCKHIRECK
jgi:hypothetical protein